MACLNVKAKRKPTKLEDMSKEQIRQAILKKRECNAKAQNIVESLLDKDISEAYFTQCLPDINQSHFEDIIEERSITKLCGYPPCSNSISESDIPKQKYRISMKTNKVYDITVRKDFCSNTCYKAAMYVKKQMLTSPLWFREYEDIPVFQLLPLDSTGSIGQEVDVSLIEKLSLKDNKRLFTSVNDFAEATVKKMSKTKENTPMENIETKDDSNKNNPGPESLKSEDGKKPNLELSISQPLPEKSSGIGKNKSAKNPLNIVGEIIERPEKKIDPILVGKPQVDSSGSKHTNNKKHQKKLLSLAAITIEVEKSLAEWFTLDTLIFLFGEEKVKELVANKGESIKEYLNNYSKGLFYTSNSYDQYQTLCRKLNMLELEDKKYDAQTINKDTKPLPDYSMLQEESKKIQLKVKAFYAGETEITEPNNDMKHDDHKNMEEDPNLTQIPLVDKIAQNAVRRKILCQQLNKVLPDLLRSLGLLTLSINSDVRLLVKTLKLKANNIMFKPIQWTLIAIIFIKLLSIRDKQLEYLMGQPTAYQHMQLLLLSYKQDGGYLDRLISWLTDIDRLLDVNDTQLTVE